MTGLRRLFMALTVTCGMCFIPCQLTASRKATDLMSEALKQRAAGNLVEAISSFEYASEQSGNALQKNLARFMLGDCQLEAGRFADAAKTFQTLSESVSTSEEKAESIFRLMQAHSGLNNQGKVSSLFSQIRRDHAKSPYFELAKSFMTTQGFKDDIEAPKPAPAPAMADNSISPNPAATSGILPDEDSAADNDGPAVGDTVDAAVTSARPETEKVAPVVAAKPAMKESKPVAGKPVSDASTGNSRGKKADSQTTALLREALHVETAVGAEKEELVSRILGLQDALKDGPEKAGMDKALLKLAEATTSFGELIEACKTYDKILAHHPASPLVEQAYYQAIRLRAVLGVHEAVTGWAKAFLAAFPASEYRSKVRALVEYSKAGGNIDLTDGGKAPVVREKKVPAVSSAGVDTGDANVALAADSQYVNAAKKMKDGKYNLALVDFNRLAKKYPNAPQIWWDTALVQVQLEDFKKAALAINKMLELDPGNQDANSLSGYIHYRLENFEEAASAYDQAGEPEGRGVNFFDAKNASERMKKSAGKKH